MGWQEKKISQTVEPFSHPPPKRLSLRGLLSEAPWVGQVKVPPKPCYLCALSSQCDLVAGGPQLQDRRAGCGKSEKAHRREGLSNPVCIWSGTDGHLCPLPAAVLHREGIEKPGFQTPSLFFLGLGGFPEFLMLSSHFFISSAFPSSIIVSHWLSPEAPCLLWEQERVLSLIFSFIYSRGLKLGLKEYQASVKKGLGIFKMM